MTHATFTADAPRPHGVPDYAQPYYAPVDPWRPDSEYTFAGWQWTSGDTAQ